MKKNRSDSAKNVMHISDQEFWNGLSIRGRAQLILDGTPGRFYKDRQAFVKGAEFAMREILSLCREECAKKPGHLPYVALSFLEDISGE